MGPNNPIALGTKTTQIEVTLLSAVGDDCTTLVAPCDATSEVKKLHVNHECRLMKMVLELRLRRLVIMGYAEWLLRQAIETGYAGWLR